MFKTLDQDRKMIERKYHNPDKEFDGFNRMAYHGYDYDEATGLSDGEIDRKIDAVITAVEGDGLGVDADVYDFRTFHSHADGVVYHFLVALGEIYRYVLKALSVTASVINTACIDADSLAETVAARIGFAFCHCYSSLGLLKP